MRAGRTSALALSLFTVALSVASCATTQPRVPATTAAGVRFEFARSDARTVTVAGTFNRWSPTAHPLERASNGVWTIVVALPPGEHAFMYVVNGSEWVVPPLAEDYVDDGFGQKNGLVRVE